MRKSISVTFFSMVATLLVLGTAVLGCSEWLLFSRYFAQERYDTLDSVARSLPGTWRAEKLQKKAADVGFDWRSVDGALDKLDEEVRELHRAVETNGNVPEELGDVLFAAVKVGRFCGVDPEEALHGTCEKFIRRFRAMEEAAAREGRELTELTLEELTALWNGAKERS